MLAFFVPELNNLTSTKKILDNPDKVSEYNCIHYAKTGQLIMALNNLAVLETYLKDIIYSEAEIISKIEQRAHIFEIKSHIQKDDLSIEENILGFISLYDLKAYIYEHEEEANNYWVKNIDSDEWKNIFDHPFFQRRKPQLVSSDILATDDGEEFYILIKGQKSGPFEKHQLLDMVEKKEILLTDMVSVNAGHVWNKLFQVDGFDRRSLKDSDQLPGMPDNDFLSKSSGETHTIPETTDAMSSLAFLGNIKRGKTIEREREVFYNDAMTKKASESTSFYKWMIAAIIIGIGYFLFNIKTNLSSPFSGTPSSAIGEQAEMLTPVQMPTSTNTNPNSNIAPSNNTNNGATNRNVFDQRRGGKFESRRMNPVRPARAAPRKSFMETKQFQDSMNNNPEEAAQTPTDDNNYYYDNATPLELDPVRSQISKENFEEPVPAPTPKENNLFEQEISN